jgi:hypothetical protein
LPRLRVDLEGAEKPVYGEIVDGKLDWLRYDLSLLIPRLVRVRHMCRGMFALGVEE